MNTFTSCGLTWYPPPADNKCPCDPNQHVRVLHKEEKDGDTPYRAEAHQAKAWLWGAEWHAGWYPVNPDGTEDGTLSINVAPSATVPAK